MITGELRSQIERIWDAFWPGGISNPLEEITCLLFLRRLDDRQIEVDRIMTVLDEVRRPAAG